MSPTTKISGWPATERSGRRCTRPSGRSRRRSPRRRRAASGAARTPAAQIRVRAAIRSSPGGPATVIPPASSVGDDRARADLDAEALERARRPPREPLVEGRQDPRAGVEQHDPRARAGSKRRKLPVSERRASSPIWPASSTPVGPPPTIANVSQAPRSLGSLLDSARSNAPKICGAQRERVVERLHPRREALELGVAEVRRASSRPRRSGCRSRARARRRRARARELAARAASIAVTSPELDGDVRLAAQHIARRRARSRRSRGSRSRPGRAAAGRGGGWSRSISVTSTGSRRSVFAAKSPPKPLPTITTPCAISGALAGARTAERAASPGAP